jgi:hypothetical protein
VGLGPKGDVRDRPEWSHSFALFPKPSRQPRQPFTGTRRANRVAASHLGRIASEPARRVGGRTRPEDVFKIRNERSTVQFELLFKRPNVPDFGD